MIRLALALFLAFCGVAQAQLAGGLQFPGPGTPHTAVVGPPTVTFVADVHSGASFASNDAIYTGVNIGTASADRFLIISMCDAQDGTGNNFTVMTLKVSGQSDIVFTFTSLAGNANGTNVIGWAAVPAAYGTTGDVYLTTAAGWSASPSIATYTTLLSTLVSTTPTTANANSASATSINASLATTSGGFIIGAGINGLSTGSTGSYGGTETYTQDSQYAFAGGIHTHSHANSITTNASNTVTLSQVGTADKMLSVAAAWR